jgi:hypothetical protein
MRFGGAALALVASMTVAHADMTYTENDHRTAEYINKRMTLTILCEKAIGPAWYQSSRSMGMIRLLKMPGMTKKEAHRLISEIDQRLHNDSRLAEMQKNASAEKCMTMLNDLDFEYGDLE